MLVLIEADLVEDVELGFGPEERGVGDSRALQISFGFLRDAARVAIVRLARDRIDNGANKTQRRFRVENVDPRARRIRNHEHVRRVNRPPTANARAVEAEPFRENVFVVFGKRGREMLPGAGQIGELEVDQFHPVVFDQFANVGCGFCFGHVVG